MEYQWEVSIVRCCEFDSHTGILGYEICCKFSMPYLQQIVTKVTEKLKAIEVCTACTNSEFLSSEML